MAISNELRNALAALLPATVKEKSGELKNIDKLALIDALADADTRAKQQAAWQVIITILNPEYYVARDNTKKFNDVKPRIEALKVAVESAITALDGALNVNIRLAEDVTQFIFKVSNWYSIASSLDVNNFDICSAWLEEARAFIANNGLKKGLQDAKWHNLIGGHRSREYQMGRNTARPIEAVNHFLEALRIHTDEIGSNLDSSAREQDRDMKHVQMCLASTMMQDAIWCIVNNTETDKIADTCAIVKKLLNDLTDARLVYADGNPDLYRRAGCAQAMGYVQIVEGRFAQGVECMAKAVSLMTEAIGTTGATGQLSAIKNDYANALIALGSFDKAQLQPCLTNARTALEESIKLSKGQFEQMYADIAKESLRQINTNISRHFYAQLAMRVSGLLPLTQNDWVRAPGIPIPSETIVAAMNMWYAYKQSRLNFQAPAVTISIQDDDRKPNSRAKEVHMYTKDLQGNEIHMQSLRKKDAGDVFKYLTSQPLVCKRYATKKTQTLEATQSRVNDLSDRFDPDSAQSKEKGLFMHGGFRVADNDTDEFLGMINTGTAGAPKGGLTEIGVRLRPDAWKNADLRAYYIPAEDRLKTSYSGLGTAAVCALWDYTCKSAQKGYKLAGANVQGMRAVAMIDNPGSWKALAKAGMTPRDVDVLETYGPEIRFQAQKLIP